MAFETTDRDIFLLPGALAFGNQGLRLRTLLGSCVSVVVWHPNLKLGGMCHFLLPNRFPVRTHEPPDGRYASDALQLLLEQMTKTVTYLDEYSAHICGGANCLNDTAGSPAGARFDIGQRNIEAAEAWCQRLRLGVLQRHVGGDTYRHVGFDVASGFLSVRSGTQAEYSQTGVGA